jgi:hypothetical protein
VLDNYHTHKHDDINQWLAKHPRITLHFTPTSGSWMNLVEVFFGIITRQAIRRGSFNSVTPAIFTLLASRHPEATLLPCEPDHGAEESELMSWFAACVRRLITPFRFRAPIVTSQELGSP